MTSELLLWCRGKEMLLNTKQMHSNKPWCGGKTFERTPDLNGEEIMLDIYTPMDWVICKE